MEKLDYVTVVSAIITAVIALIALISPVVTTCINNKHMKEMKQMEYDHDNQLERERRNREIYEGYIRAAGACIQSRSTETLQRFGEHSALAIYYVPEDVRTDMLTLEKMMRGSSEYREQKIELLSQIALKLRQYRPEQ
ncbi:MAG: hypothetical protein LUE61_07170 [Clostridiales bacterium]|nr:hypothetical protein [Clostridiales bacterium]